MPVIIAARPDVPVARVSVLFKGGYTADQGRKPGTASFAMSLLDEGAGKLDALAIADRAERLGAQLAAGASLDTSFAVVSTLTEQLDPSLALLADVVRRPAFPAQEIERVRKEWIAGIAREKLSPDALAHARAAAAAVRRGPSVRHSVLGLGHRGVDRRARRARTCSPSSAISCDPTTRRSSSPVR